MSLSHPSSVNDPGTVVREYASEERFLARRLAAHAELFGPLVEDAAIEAMSEADPDRVVDIGCGTGDYSERVRTELGVDLVAVDLSPTMVDLARARGLDAGVADIESLPFADAEFDCVLASRVLYHLPDLDAGMAEIVRVLRPGGILVAITYSERHLSALYESVGRSPPASPFSAENGDAVLGRHFQRVERDDLTGTARFASPDAVVRLLGAHEEFGYFTGVDLAHRVAEVRFPFDATYCHTLFVARKARQDMVDTPGEETSDVTRSSPQLLGFARRLRYRRGAKSRSTFRTRR